jgi:hypothetical protein
MTRKIATTSKALSTRRAGKGLWWAVLCRGHANGRAGLSIGLLALLLTRLTLLLLAIGTINRPLGIAVIWSIGIVSIEHGRRHAH